MNNCLDRLDLTQCQFRFNLTQSETVTVYLPPENILNQEEIRQFARYKENVLTQVQEVIQHYD